MGTLGNRSGSPLQEGSVGSSTPKPAQSSPLGALGNRQYSGTTPSYINRETPDEPQKQIGLPIGPNATPYDQSQAGNAPGTYQTGAPAPANFDVQPAVMRFVPEGSFLSEGN